jgi:hypothetical protein
MTRLSVQTNETPILSQELLLNVAEELKMPLMQIARLAESERLSSRHDVSQNSCIIEATAESALQLIDNYALGIRLSLEPQNFDIESVSVSSVLYDTCHQLDALAKTYGVNLELNVSGRYGPVEANRRGLQAALASLGAALIEALPAIDGKRQLNLQLATHRSRYGIVAGIYSETKNVSTRTLSSARRLGMASRQPLVNLSHKGGSGVFVAEAILRAMNLSLTTSRHNNLYGIATILQPNHQLELIK